LEISRSRFKWKTKSCNILYSIRKLLFPAYSYDEISASCNVIKDELSSCHNLFLGYFQIHFFSNLKKKKWNTTRCCFEQYCAAFSPRRVEVGEEEVCSLYFLALTLSQDLKNRQDPHLLNCQDKITEKTSPAVGCPVAARPLYPCVMTGQG
jgi:hypothetical protein